MSRIGSLLLLMTANAAVAQPPTRLDQIGAVARSQPDFHGAIAGPGESVRVEWALSAPTVELGKSVKLTLTVHNAVNPRELLRPDLSKRSDFAALFSPIEAWPEPPPAEDAKAVSFVYSLRPRTVGTIQLPTLKYLFYHPRAPKGREMQTRFLDPLTLTVTEPTVPPAPLVPLTGPESFFEPARGSSSSTAVPMGYWLTLALGTPLLLLIWVGAWHWLFPDAARLAKVRRNRAVRRILDRLRAAHRKPDPAGETAAAFRQYLSARFGLPSVAVTPDEVATGLLALNFPPHRMANADELLRRCDADRFAPIPSGSAVATEAARLVERWEGVSP